MLEELTKRRDARSLFQYVLTAWGWKASEKPRDTAQTRVDDLNTQISSVRQEIKALESSRSEKAGYLGNRLSDLKI